MSGREDDLPRRTDVADERTDTPQAAPRAAGLPPTIRWDHSNLKSSYANVCNVSSTREEVKRLAGLLANVVREYESRFGTLNVEVGRADGGRQEEPAERKATR